MSSWCKNSAFFLGLLLLLYPQQIRAQFIDEKTLWRIFLEYKDAHSTLFAPAENLDIVTGKLFAIYQYHDTKNLPNWRSSIMVRIEGHWSNIEESGTQFDIEDMYLPEMTIKKSEDKIEAEYYAGGHYEDGDRCYRQGPMTLDASKQFFQFSANRFECRFPDGKVTFEEKSIMPMQFRRLSSLVSNEYIYLTDGYEIFLVRNEM